MKIQEHKIIRISWIDASTNSGWRSADKDETDEIESVGILVHKDKKAVVLSTSVSRWGHYLDQLSIPTTAIKKLRYL